jgi:5,10-methylenetetrahydromethanopterin reductase
MKFGLAMPSRLTIQEQMKLAQTCDQNDISVWVPDERFFRDVFVTMAGIATATSKTTIGTGVTDPLVRHPLLTATAIASLHELSGGRAIMGIGAGISGFDAMGIQRISPATALRDAVKVCRQFWNDEAVSYEGKTFVAKNAHMHFKSKQVPIYIAGRGPQILAAGGEMGDGVIIGHFTSKEGISFCQENIDKGLQKRDKTMAKPEIALWAYTSVCEDGTLARNAVKPAIGRTLKSTPEVLELFGVKAPGLLDEINRFGYARSREYDEAMWTAVPDELTLHLSISGTPKECVEQLKRIAACGVAHVIALPYPAEGMDPVEMSDLLRKEVFPKARDF